MSVRKIERNKLLIEKRDSDPKKYSFGALGEIFSVSKITAFQIYNREKVKKYGIKKR